MGETRLRCEDCGDVIGVYEPVRWQRPDGTIAETGYLEVAGDPLGYAAGSRLYHRGCLAAGSLSEE